jgi:hypothetical protein
MPRHKDAKLYFQKVAVKLTIKLFLNTPPPTRETLLRQKR